MITDRVLSISFTLDLTRRFTFEIVRTLSLRKPHYDSVFFSIRKFTNRNVQDTTKSYSLSRLSKQMLTSTLLVQTNTLYKCQTTLTSIVSDCKEDTRNKNISDNKNPKEFLKKDLFQNLHVRKFKVIGQ